MQYHSRSIFFKQSEQYSAGAQRDPEEKLTKAGVIQLARIQRKIISWWAGCNLKRKSGSQVYVSIKIY